MVEREFCSGFINRINGLVLKENRERLGHLYSECARTE